MSKEFSRKFYRSKAWREGARLAALHRDQYTCHDCGGRGTEVHHRVELTPENINDPAIALGLDNLEVLCWACHDKRTKQGEDGGDVPGGYEFNSEGQVIRR